MSFSLKNVHILSVLYFNNLLPSQKCNFSGDCPCLWVRVLRGLARLVSKDMFLFHVQLRIVFIPYYHGQVVLQYSTMCLLVPSHCRERALKYRFLKLWKLCILPYTCVAGPRMWACSPTSCWSSTPASTSSSTHGRITSSGQRSKQMLSSMLPF